MEDNTYLDMDILRFTTAGSVDDGKSTLIGRLLYDAKAIFEDQLQQIKDISERKGLKQIDLSLLTDGLKDESEQGITIDVAYRYFSTPKRKYIIADTPGHLQYTRNMVTGASTANLALILVDARKGIVEQTYRHSYIASLLQIPNIIICVNKMDLVDYSEEVYQNIVNQYETFATKLNVNDIRFIPISALKGDNVVHPSKAMPWYNGITLMEQLDTIKTSRDENLNDARFAVQTVIRPQDESFHDFRGYAGRVDGGIFRVGEEIIALPSRLKSTIKEIILGGIYYEEAFESMSVTITLNDDIDISRGDIITKQFNPPSEVKEVYFIGCWLNEKPMNQALKYAVRCGTNLVHGKIQEILYRIDIAKLTPDNKEKNIGVNDIFKAKLQLSQPLFVDSYLRNRKTGSIILIDEYTNETIAAGMIVDSNFI